MPVNESAWEHLKLGLGALIVFSLIEYPFIGRKVSNYFFAKAIGVLIINASILMIYYTYTFFTGSFIVIIDITSYVIGAVLCQVISYKIYQRRYSPSLNRMGILLLVVWVAVFTVCTFYPPKIRLFKDTNTNTYGIPVAGK